MNDCTFNSQYLDFEDLDEPTTSAQAYKNRSSLGASHVETDIDNGEDEDEEVDETCVEEPLWSIDDDTLFHPLGLINHSTEIGKSVFVTWNEICIQNFIFKKSKRTKKINMTTVRLTLPTDEEVQEILILEYNTLLLMRSGNVFYFSSVKSMHSVSWLKGVRCISKAPDGFSVIRILEDNSIKLEMYQDIPSIGKNESTLITSYDITFDSENIFNCQWADERFTLLSQLVEAETLPVTSQFLRNCVQLNENDLIHFFTVSGNIFALTSGNPKDRSYNSEEYHIELLNTYASPVECFKIDYGRQIFLVFLQSGYIDVWFVAPRFKLLQRLAHFTGTSFVHYDYNALNATFYYTDTEKVGQLEFRYDDTTDFYTVQESFKAIPDIIVCSWVDHIQQLICLSSNNIFYRLSFDPSDAPASLEPNPEFENFLDLYELTKSKMVKLMAKANFAKELATLPAKIHNQIEEECLKQQLVGIHQKRKMYMQLLKASVTYRKHLNVTEDKEVLYFFIQDKGYDQLNSIYAFIDIRRKANSIFENNVWNLHVDTGKSVHSFPISTDFRHKKLCVIFQINCKPLEPLPSLDLNLVTFLNNDCNEFLAILLPIELEYNSSSYASLFSLHDFSTHSFNLFNINHLLESFNERNHSTSFRINNLSLVSLSLPHEMKFRNICQLFNFQNDILEEHETFNVYFLSTLIRLEYIEQTSSLNLECACPVVLWYIKLYLMHFIQEFVNKVGANDDKPTTSKKALLFTQYQCEVERCYGSLIETDSDDMTTESAAFHLENLKRIYKKLRSTPLKLFK